MVLPLLALLAMSDPSAKLLSFNASTSFPPVGPSQTQDLGTLDPGMDFDEAIVSWNVDNPAAAEVKVNVQAVQNGIESKSFCLADWSYDTHLHPRTSVNGQKDALGAVMTDTLHLNSPAQKLKLSLDLSTLSPGESPKLKLVTVCFSNTKTASSISNGPSPAWGKNIDVPERAQNNYPNGGVLCSATTVSMMLWHYAKELGRPELNRDVPEVEAGVWDVAFKGAGNWPFNTAYAGGFPGIRAYVARFNSMSDLEKWIEAGIPVGISVSFDMLRGKPLSPQESGHLIVLTGFLPNGDPLVNDPAFKDGVHKSYPRADFEKAWAYSHHTVYLIYPESAKVPANTDGLWVP